MTLAAASGDNSRNLFAAPAIVATAAPTAASW
jgi:hypothetical protein